MTQLELDNTVSRYLCIGCPMGCRLEVEESEGEIVEVRGFTCKRGEQYARQEHTEPRRMVTTTVKVDNGIWARVPVRTQEAIPKDKVKALCKRLRQITLEAPVTMGQVILEDALSTGVNVVASRDLPIL
jgi:CxxC motif-containing protein